MRHSFRVNRWNATNTNGSSGSHPLDAGFESIRIGLQPDDPRGWNRLLEGEGRGCSIKSKGPAENEIDFKSRENPMKGFDTVHTFWANDLFNPETERGLFPDQHRKISAFVISNGNFKAPQGVQDGHSDDAKHDHTRQL
jgi:hypothetical protein